MKNVVTLFTTFLFLQFTSLAQEGWFEQTFDTTLNFTSVHFVNENIGWIVGGEYQGQGYIYKTTNGGTNWQKQLGDTIPKLNSIYFLNENFGCAVGDSGTILNTDSGGELWLDNSLEFGNWHDVRFLNDNIGYAINFPGDGGNVHQESFKANYNYLSVIKTTDGGINWIAISPPGQGYAKKSLSFVDTELGYIIERLGGTIFKTTNGGVSWDSLQISVYGLIPEKIYFIDELYGWVVGWESGTPIIGSIHRTTDGGISWENQFFGGGIIFAIHFNNENVGWAVGSYYVGGKIIVHTTNGGMDWAYQVNDTTAPNWCILEDVFFINENIGWVVGHDGTILKTINGGVSFIEENEFEEIPTDYTLSHNYPNPFNPTTKIKYSIPRTSQVQIKVFDVLGNEIKTLVNEEKLTGTYETTWSAFSLPSGVYFYQLKAGNFIQTRKMILIK